MSVTLEHTDKRGINESPRKQIFSRQKKWLKRATNSASLYGFIVTKLHRHARTTKNRTALEKVKTGIRVANWNCHQGSICENIRWFIIIIITCLFYVHCRINPSPIDLFLLPCDVRIHFLPLNFLISSLRLVTSLPLPLVRSIVSLSITLVVHC